MRGITGDFSRLRRAAMMVLGVYILVFYGAISLLSVPQYAGISKTVSDLLGLLGEGTGIFIIGIGLRWQEKSRRTAWRLFGLGIAMIFIGDLIWSSYDTLLQLPVPFPSICDVFYSAGSLVFLVALIFYIRHEKLFDIVRIGFDIVITMVVSTTVMFQYIMLPIWNDVSMTALQKCISMAYPVFDMGYLGGIFSLFFCAPKSKENRANQLICVAFLILFGADQLYALLAGSSYVSGGYIDPLWPIGCWILAVASLYPAHAQREETRAEQVGEGGRKQLLREYFRFLFPYFGVSLIIILVSAQYIFKDSLVTGTVITVLLIMVRQIFSLLENRKLIRMIQTSNQLLEAQNMELQQLNDLKEREANTDFLTQLFNRRYIDETLRSLAERSAVGSEAMEMSILLIDIDHYKQINDRWGHEAGDAVLRQIAALIKRSIRAEDIAGRFGGDEFIVLLPHADFQSARFIAERLVRKASEEPFQDKDEALRVTLSIGCAQWKGFANEYDSDAIIAAADRALYQAKERGRNQYVAETM